MSRESQVQERAMSAETADSGDSGNGVAVRRRVSSAGVPAKPKRRQFSAEFKARIVEEAEGWLTIETPQRERHEVHSDDIETREEAPSSMPDNVGEQLSREELRDVIAFLASLRDE